MKIFIGLICLMVRSALAAEVEAVGYGRTAEEALNNAKTAAIEKIAGTFVVSNTVKMTQGINLKVTHLTFFRNA